MGCKPLFGVAKVVVDHSVTIAAGCGHLPVLLNNPNPPKPPLSPRRWTPFFIRQIV